MSDDVVYPSAKLILDLHEQVVEDSDETEPGVRSEEAIESALQYISEDFSAKFREHSTKKQFT